MTELLLIIGRILHLSSAINVAWELTVEFRITLEAISSTGAYVTSSFI
jgi:hypothetical protein